MPAAVYRMTIEQGATFVQVFTFEDLDLTGYTGRGQIRETTSEATAVVQRPIPDPVPDVDPFAEEPN
jgi:hypothetical protein